MTTLRSTIALIIALGLFVGIAGMSVSAQAADAAVGDTPVTFDEPWRPSVLPPVIAGDNALLKAGSWAIVVSTPEEGATFADQVVTSLGTYAPHVTADVLTVVMDEATLQTGTFQNSGETFAYLALAPTAEVSFVQVAVAPEADLAAAVTAAQATVKVGDAAPFAGVTIDERSVTVQTTLGTPSASPAATPAS